MNIAIVLFTLGVIMVVAGYTNQISPNCNADVKVKIVPRKIFDEILYNQELTDQVYNDQIGVTGPENINDDNIMVDMVNKYN